jgi:hypothetical protein
VSEPFNVITGGVVTRRKHLGDPIVCGLCGGTHIVHTVDHDGTPVVDCPANIYTHFPAIWENGDVFMIRVRPSWWGPQ